jgi:hypothetical protein
VRLILPLLLFYRRLRYGYPFLRIPLSRGKFAIVDPEDYPTLARHKWYAKDGRRTRYAQRNVRDPLTGKQVLINMHRQILSIPPHLVGDHVNRNGLDNRKANVRPATRSQNAYNTAKPRVPSRSEYKGVHWRSSSQKWRVEITAAGRKTYIGTFHDEVRAAKAYDRAAEKYHGQFAVLNFPAPRPSLIAQLLANLCARPP